MLDIKRILNDYDEVLKGLASRNFDVLKLEEIKEMIVERSTLMTKQQSLEAEKNKLSKSIGAAKANGEDIEPIMEKVSEIKREIEQIGTNTDLIQENLIKHVEVMPNVPNANTPEGDDETDNVIIKENGKIGRGKVTDVKAHYEIGVELGIIDFERTVKISGARFWSYIGKGAKLVRALENFLLDTNIENGYTEFRPPVLVKASTMYGTGQLPKFKDDLFKISESDLYLIPTAEVPLTNFYSDEILDLTETRALTAFTPCFRSEAGSGGKDMRGLIRAHQFNKVEIVRLTTKERGQEDFQKALTHAKGMLELLGLPYQELRLCTGDVGFSAEETIDLEVWIPNEERYREISSVSYFGEFQGRRAKMRYRDENGKTRYVHTVNGSALAIDRTMAAILEIYQNEDGSIDVPEVLQKYTGFKKIG